MTDLLTDESPQVYHPTLATWVGLNEAIFLAQLNFILTRNDTVGKFADGRKWYRDKPHDFVVKYFPFWDEGTVKRTIANLKADALILARSDLNKDPKDRSLWYTINYPALERLAGPVERITRISEMRKEARKARISKRDNYPDDTEVQSVPDGKSAKCTDENQQSVLLTSVQNVPTPKDSLPKDSKTPNGVGDKPPPEPDKPKKQLMGIFTTETGLKMPHRKSDVSFWWSSIREIYEIVDNDVGAGSDLIRQVVKKMRADGLTISNPNSIINICRTLAAEKSVTRNGKSPHLSAEQLAVAKQYDQELAQQTQRRNEL